MSRKRLDPWPAWMAVAGLGFAVFETRALVKGDIPTLSENLAKWAGVHPRRVHGNVAPVLLLAGAGWLVVHIATWGTGKPGDASEWVPLAERGARRLKLVVEEAA